MKNLKLILPMLAFVLAIGMSFAFTSATGEDYYAAGFIETSPNNWDPVTVECPTNGDNDCRVYFSSNPSEVYLVHDSPNGSVIKTTAVLPVEL